MRTYVREWSNAVKGQNLINNGGTGGGEKPHKLDRDWEKLLLAITVGNRKSMKVGKKHTSVCSTQSSEIIPFPSTTCATAASSLHLLTVFENRP